MRTVAALYVEPKGCYVGVPGVDPWDEARDARKYAGPHPVVAHPPCQRWGRFWHGSTRKPHQYKLGDDGGCFEAAWRDLRRWGGVLEHPAHSHAFNHFGIMKPTAGAGWQFDLLNSVWICYVEQGHYGHASRKPTWLIACGVPRSILPELNWAKGEQRLPAWMVERYGYEKARRIGVVAMVGGKNKTAIRNATQRQFLSVTCCWASPDPWRISDEPRQALDRAAVGLPRPRGRVAAARGGGDAASQRAVVAVSAADGVQPARSEEGERRPSQKHPDRGTSIVVMITPSIEPPSAPVVVSYGGGTNSTALLILMKRCGQVPALIMFADTGDEKPHTYEHLHRMQDWCRDNGFPPIVVVRNELPAAIKDQTLYGECFRKGTLPSKVFGYSSCSMKWKVEPQYKYLKRWMAERGIPFVVHYVGFDADEEHRAAKKAPLREFEINRYPLIEADWGRDECVAAIDEEGLPRPGKSACFMCPSSRKPEVIWLKREHPDLYAKAIALEARALKGEGQAPAARVDGLGRHWNWATFAGSDVGVPEVDCGCYDGESEPEPAEKLW